MNFISKLECVYNRNFCNTWFCCSLTGPRLTKPWRLAIWCAVWWLTSRVKRTWKVFVKTSGVCTDEDDVADVAGTSRMAHKPTSKSGSVRVQKAWGLLPSSLPLLGRRTEDEVEEVEVPCWRRLRSRKLLFLFGTALPHWPALKRLSEDMTGRTRNSWKINLVLFLLLVRQTERALCRW